MTLRSGFWIFLSTLGIIFMHNKVLTADTEENAKGYSGLFEETARGKPDAVPINIPDSRPMPSFDVSKLAMHSVSNRQYVPLAAPQSPVNVTISVPGGVVSQQ